MPFTPSFTSQSSTAIGPTEQNTRRLQIAILPGLALKDCYQNLLMIMSPVYTTSLRTRYAKVFWTIFIVGAVTNVIAGYITVVAFEPPRQQLHKRGKRDLHKPCVKSPRSRVNCPSMRPTIRRGHSLQYSQYQLESSVETVQEYFISDAQFVHLGPAARILTEEFYSQKTNFITFQIERLKTVLSLESTFPNQQNSLRNEYSVQPLQKMIVACNAKSGEVVGFAEVDARSLGNNENGGASDTTTEDGASASILRSYMYNLAVDKQWKRKGIASALVEACEDFVSNTHNLCIEKRLYLRVRKCNHAAVGLYEKMGYQEMNPEMISLNKEDINSGSLEDGELILFAKDLPLDDECIVDYNDQA